MVRVTRNLCAFAQLVGRSRFRDNAGMNRFALGIGLLVLGCSGNRNDDASEMRDNEPEEEIECDRSDRDGTYLLSWDERDGTCGPVPDSLVRFEQDSGSAFAATDGGCDVIESEWSDDDCRNEIVIECLSEDGVIISAIGITTSNESGSRIEGTIQMRLDDELGYLCEGLYDVTYERQ